MAKVTLIFALLLVLLGLAGYLGTGSQHPTALIPAWFGLALAVFGILAMNPNPGRRKLFMHINVTVGLLGFLGAGIRAIQSYGHARSQGIDPDMIAIGSQLTMAGLLFVYVAMCVKSFVDARRSGTV